jgi:hypothetical protein
MEFTAAAETCVYTFAPVNYYAIGAYLLLMSRLGFTFKKLCHDSKDYLIDTNKIPWWLAGSSIFMMSFNSSTFTAAAGFAYKHNARHPNSPYAGFAMNPNTSLVYV